MASIIMYIVIVCITHFIGMALCCEIWALTSGKRAALIQEGRSAVFKFPRQQSKHAELADILVQGLNWLYRVHELLMKKVDCCWLLSDGCCIVGLFCIEVMHVRIWMFGYHSIELTAKITVNWLKLRIKILHHTDCSTKFCIAFK